MKPILVTQPSLPDLKEFTKSLEKIWESKWLTNNGQFHQEFERELAKHLGVPYISLFSNGTLALMTALQVLDIQGEVITTPYSFVATTHAMLWNNITPVFCDIDLVYGNLDPDKIEALITDKTTAIVPVHVYGNPVEVEKIEKIANKYNLKVIYDAAHAFGVEKDKKSILNFGDLSVLSFHATKTFNTIEGGAIVCHDAETKKKIDYLKNFGFENETSVVQVGINAKMNELQAAFGLLQLKNIDRDIVKRKKVAEIYQEGLNHIKGIRFLNDIPGVKHNYSYFPIFIEKDYPLTRDELYQKLKDHQIFARRYFYPLISDFEMYRNLESTNPTKLINAVIVANEVICLPIYPKLDEEIILDISHLINISNE
ncbi:MAG: DegT/DnrJ/EryC1/StrS family aminotransferase [Flavobacteriaceae bacterium]|nr:DegT/DnrJ/EryC1/StrS family aminotransferase [Flavobacteriaceae bacterium]